MPDEYLGSVLKLCQDRRGRQKNLTYVGARAMVVYELPLNEVVFDFYDRLKSVSPRLCLVRLPHQGLRGGRPRQAVDPGQRRAGRCAVDDRAPRARRKPRPRDVREAEGADPAAPVPDPDPGGDRRQGDRARDHPRAAQGRASPSATAATSRASASCSTSRRRARRRCASSATSRSRRKPSSPR